MEVPAMNGMCPGRLEYWKPMHQYEFAMGTVLVLGAADGQLKITLVVLDVILETNNI